MLKNIKFILSLISLYVVFLVIKNRTQLLPAELNEQAKDLRRLGLECLEIAIKAVRPSQLVINAVHLIENELIIQGDRYDLSSIQKIFIIGAGKASGEMALTLERIIREKTTLEYEGIINIPKGLEIPQDEQSNITLNFASHPIPDERGVWGAKSMLELLKHPSQKSLIICLISGGGSALLSLPKEGISLSDLKELNSLLLASGANIHEINTLRKHLSDVKGGNLIKNIRQSNNSTIISLIISDVVGDNLEIIASGPTVEDTSAPNDAINIVKKYNLLNKLPVSIINVLNTDKLNEKKQDFGSKEKIFQNVHNYLIGSVKWATQQIEDFLIENGFNSEIFSDCIIGEAKDFGYELYELINKKIGQTHHTANLKEIAMIGTGELTVTIQGKGIGGRNQEMLLSLLNEIKALKKDLNYMILAANLDGIEGNSSAMGALIDNFTLSIVEKEHIDIEQYLNNNDSNSFFKRVRSEILTGPTGCNVNDLILILLML